MRFPSFPRSIGGSPKFWDYRPRDRAASRLAGPRSELAALASLIFLLCFTSFAIVLTLGGGRARNARSRNLRSPAGRSGFRPRGLARARSDRRLHQLRGLPAPDRDASRPQAGRTRLSISRARHGGPENAPSRPARACRLRPAHRAAPGERSSGLQRLPALIDGDVAHALATSLVLATVSASVSCLMALALAAAARRERLVRRHQGDALIYDLVPAAVLAMPPFALTAGLYLLVRRAVDPALAGYALLPLINALGALPFAYRFIAPAMDRRRALWTALGFLGPAGNGRTPNRGLAPVAPSARGRLRHGHGALLR